MKEQDRNSIVVGDISLNYYRRGNGNKALILIHGNSENATVFADYIETVDPKYKAYAIDTRGHGLSTGGKGSFSIKTMAIDIMRFINQKPFETVSIVGYSDGANIAMYLAKIAPRLIDKMVLISGNLYAKAINRTFYNKALLKYKFFKVFEKISTKARIAANRMEIMLNNVGVYPEDLSSITIPTLVIDAENDLIDKEHTALIARSLPRSERLTIKDADHYTIIKAAALFDAVNNFVNA
ncbi:MAG: alpha/beta hydrolase [Clostridia bacterium]|nr:alpha/beta hydrolase [Clostridia bacterium]